MENLKELELKTTLLKLKKILEINAFVSICLLCAAPLIGLFIYYPQAGGSADLAIVDAKSYFVKIIGWYCLVSGLISVVVNSILYGFRNILISNLKNPWNILFLVTILFSIISIFRVPFDKTSNALNGVYFIREGFLAYLAYWGIYLAASSLKKTKYKMWAIRALIFSSAFLGICVLVDKYLGIPGLICHTGRGEAITGTYINRNHYGYYLCLASIVSLACFIYAKNNKWRVIYGFVYAINIFILNKINSLGPLLAFLVGMILFIIFTFVRKEKQYYMILGTTAFITIALIAAINRRQLYVELPATFKDLFTLMKSVFGGAEQAGDSSYAVASGRNHLWVDALTLIKEQPIFGHGIGREIDLYTIRFGYSDAAHNEYLSLAIAIGIPGAICFLIGNLYILIFSIVNVKDLPKNMMIAALGVGTYFISSMFGVSLPTVEFAFFMVLGMLNSHYNENYQKLEIN